MLEKHKPNLRDKIRSTASPKKRKSRIVKLAKSVKALVSKPRVVKPKANG